MRTSALNFFMFITSIHILEGVQLKMKPRNMEILMALLDLRHPDVLPVIAENKTNGTSNTSIFISRSRLHVSTLIASSSGLLFETSL
jgi:hypothetical protein